MSDNDGMTFMLEQIKLVDIDKALVLVGAWREHRNMPAYQSGHQKVQSGVPAGTMQTIVAAIPLDSIKSQGAAAAAPLSDDDAQGMHEALTVATGAVFIKSDLEDDEFAALVGPWDMVLSLP